MVIKVKKKTRKAREKKTAEVFTPDFLVNEMLGKLPRGIWNKGKTFCDPAAGNGQFLIHILIKKIIQGHKPSEALATIYGADIMSDNIRECRFRLLEEVNKYEPITVEHVKIVMKNIVHVSLKKFPRGSLDYDFTFSNCIKTKDAEKWLKYFKDQNTPEPEVQSESREDEIDFS